MRIWVDITDASAVVFFAPVIRRLEDAGHTVTLTARRFAGADLVLKRYGLGGVLTTQHRGGSLGTRAVGLVNRTAQLLGSASSGRFDVAAGSHASDFVLTAWTLAVPQMTFLDPDRLGRSNLVNVRLVDEVAVPEAVPVSASRPSARRATSSSATPASRRSTTCTTRSRTRTRWRGSASSAGASPASCGRRRRACACRRGESPASDEDRLLRAPRRPRRTAQRHARRRRARPGPAADGSWPSACPSVLVPDGPVDGVGPAGRRRLRRRARRRDAARGRRPRHAGLHALAVGRPGRGLAARRRPPDRAAPADDIVLRKKDTRTTVAAPRDPGLFAERLVELAAAEPPAAPRPPGPGRRATSRRRLV